ncbi:MAG: GGDEF domain-containing protein, partial [Myxococcales bacterium]|nr:GGDEF domain-containing protein [Myxococcales bacterium]
FKQVNDRLGHAAGDVVLAQVARAIKGCTRGGDLAARYGGEEFLVVVRGAGIDVAQRIGERYRNAVRKVEVPAALGPEHAGSRPVTVSVGIAASTLEESLGRVPLLAAADAALYEAKLAGRDRVVVQSGLFRIRCDSAARAP